MALQREGNVPQGQAAPPPEQSGAPNVRYDPVLYKTEIASLDWRSGTTTNALLINTPAVQGTRMDFFRSPTGQYSDFSADAKAPFESTLFQLRLVLNAQFERAGGLIAAAREEWVPRGVQLAQVFGRGRFSLTLDGVPTYTDFPVAAIGGATGVCVEGAPIAGGAYWRGKLWTDAFPLPEPIQCDTNKPRFQGWIEIDPADLLYLGVGVAALGVGAPLAADRYLDAALALQNIGPLPTKIGLHFFGQRGLHVKAGQMPSAPGYPCMPV